MTVEESLNELRGLKGEVLDNLTNMADQLASTDDMGFDALLAIAKTTGKVELLHKAFAQLQKMPDSPDKAESMLDLLDEIELRLAVLSQPEQRIDAEPQQAEANQS